MKRLLQIVEDCLRLYRKYGFFKTPGAVLISSGIVLLTLATPLSWFATLNVEFQRVSLKSGANSGPDTPWLTISISVIGLLLVVVGAFILLRTVFKNEKMAERKRVLAVQLIGLNDVIVAPLESAIPSDVIGQRDPVRVEIREMLKGAHRLDAAINEVDLVKRHLIQKSQGLAAEDFSVHAGGLGPVPLLFQLGNVLEDESHIQWWEWNKQAGWVLPNHGVAVQTWQASNLDTINLTPEVVVRAGLTYSIETSEVERAFPGLPVIDWAPPQSLFRMVIDEQSCVAICSEFKALLRALKTKGVTQVHLLLAASTVLAMRLGSVYDPRNMVDLVVYQYEKNSPNPYPWGLSIKALHGEKHSFIVRR